MFVLNYFYMYEGKSCGSFKINKDIISKEKNIYDWISIVF